MSRWRDAYNLHNELKSNWPKTSSSYQLFKYLLYPGHNPDVRGLVGGHELDYLFEKLVYLGPGRPELKIQEFQKYELQPPDPHLVESALRLREIINEAFKARQPFEDVYQAALHIRYMGDYAYWNPHGIKCYRGQRFTWPVLPTLFRCHPSEEELNDRMNRIASFSEALDNKYPGQFDEYQRIAIAQHYGVKTWLVDLTLDPWVALFFASLDGATGDIGTVTAFSRKGWESLSVGGQNRLGAIKLIKVSGVPRIEAQKALFLDGSHPDLVEQYVGMEIQFCQQSGLIFEDTSRGITKENLLPEDDSFAAFIAGWESNPQRPTRPLGVKPPNDAVMPLGPSDYTEIALSWYKEDRRSLIQSKGTYSLLTKVCDFHARLQTKREHVNIAARSLHRLAAAKNNILRERPDNRIPLLEEVIDQYLVHADEHARHVIWQILSEIRGGKAKSEWEE
ncbi:MAG: hypothetical protein A2099_04835 [Planctomycetes bacterium GWF2_39_10]|nr:MAG: hypothetical protein A2099_04835 [Planctomycetes bacterium GWF2_39_10]